MPDFLNIIFISLLAGLATGLGGLIAIIRKPGEHLFGFLMGFTAGVMIALAFGLVFESQEHSGFMVATIGFTAGALLMFALDILIPHIRFAVRENGRKRSSMVNTGLLIAAGITLHNIPEGIAVGAGYLHTPALGVFVALAVAAHNFPEGIAVAVPVFMGGASKRKAVALAFLSGLAEPVGATLAVLLLRPFQGIVPTALSFAGGVMIFITLDELVPFAHKHGHEHFTPLGIIAGVVSMLFLMGIFGI
ncbi:MAG: ZIP family metal transporter [Candidatus Edwardsbacteria bacterium]|jgi:ZIP family zinc transporter|nr:ZIP family metal transporter [Candidatus Edwardsbacteria bacterium]